MLLTASRRVRRVVAQLLTVVLVAGIAAVVVPAGAASAATSRTIIVGGDVGPGNVGDVKTFTARMDDGSAVPNIYIGQPYRSYCRLNNYNPATLSGTVELLAGGTCEIWFEYNASIRGSTYLYIDPHRVRHVVVENLPGAVPLSAGQASFTAYGDGDHGPLDGVAAVAVGAHDTCHIAGYDRTTFQVTVDLLRGTDCRVRMSTNQNSVYTAATRDVDIAITDPHRDQNISWNLPARAPAWADAPITLSATSDSGQPVTYSTSTPQLCAVTDGKLVLVSAQAILPNSSANCVVTASAAGDSSWYPTDPVTRTVELYLSARTQTIDWPIDWRGLASEWTAPLLATASSGLPITYESLTPYYCSVSGNTVVAATVYFDYRDCTIRATQQGLLGSWSYVSADHTWSITPGTAPVVDYNAQLVFPQILDHSVSDGPFTVIATGSLPTAVYSQSTNVCTASGHTVTVTAVGVCSLIAIQSQNQYQQAVSKTQSFQVLPAAQTIDFPAIADHQATDGPFALEATASTGLPVTFSTTTPNVCSATGPMVRLFGAGLCTVLASASDDAHISVTEARSFQVTATPQTIDFPVIAAVQAADGPIRLAAIASSGLPVTFTASTPDVCTAADGLLALHAPGTCTVRAAAGNSLWADAAVEQSFAVTPSAQTVTFPVIADHHAADAGFELGASASSGLPITYSTSTPEVCSVIGSTLNLRGAGVCSVNAAAGSELWTAASAQRTFSVSLSSQTLTFVAPGDHVMTDDPFTLDATSTSGLPVAFSSSTPGVCTVDGSTVTVSGAGTCTVTASASDDLWSAASVERSFAVTPAAVPIATQQIRFNAIAGLALSRHTAVLAVSSSSALPVTLTSLTAAVCSATGRTVTLRAHGICTVRATQAGNATVHPAAPVMLLLPVWGTPSLATASRLTAVLAVLGRGEDNLHVVSSTPACRVTGSGLVMAMPGACRVSVLDAQNRVVRRLSTTVSSTIPAQVAGGMRWTAAATFPAASAQLSGAEQAKLRTLARSLRTAKLVVVYGHAEFGGPRLLPASRANAVADFLRSAGVNVRPVTVGLPPEKPGATARPHQAQIFSLS
jgi:hypothetical protein